MLDAAAKDKMKKSLAIVMALTGDIYRSSM
jgi:hypothetical protein